MCYFWAEAFRSRDTSFLYGPHGGMCRDGGAIRAPWRLNHPMGDSCPEELPIPIGDLVWMRKNLLCCTTEIWGVFVTEHNLSYPDYFTNFFFF